MATTEQRLAALEQKMQMLTTPPDDYYMSRWTGEEIDAAVEAGVNAISKLLKYYPASTSPDINAILDGSFVVPINLSQGCPLTGSWVVIYQFFYGSVSVSSPRVQVGLPYTTTKEGHGMAVRTYSTEGVWSGWEKMYTDQQPPTAAEVGAAQSLDIPATSVFATGWYRIAVVKFKSGSSKASFLLNINHVYAEGGPSNLWLAVSAVGYAEKITVLQNSFYNTQLIDNFRLVEIASSPLTFALDVRYNTTNSNLVHGKAILGSSYDVEIIPQAFTPVGETVEGETVKCYADWQDPPMKLGIEYRTTERYNGKPVYTKLFDFGYLPVNTFKIVAHNIANVQQVLSVTGSPIDGKANIPTQSWMNGYWKNNVDLIADKSNIQIVTKDCDSILTETITIYVTLKYTKTTD